MAHGITVPSLFPPPDYRHVTVVGAGETLAFAAGAVPLAADGTLVGAGDRVAQTRQVLDNLAAALAAAGSGLDHVVNSTVHVVAAAPQDMSGVWDVVRDSPLGAGPHTSTLVGVSCLGYPGQLVEITATAVVPPAGEPL